MIEMHASTLVGVVSTIIGLLVVIVGGLIKVLSLQARQGERLDAFQRDLEAQNARLVAAVESARLAGMVMVTSDQCTERRSYCEQLTQERLAHINQTLNEIRDALRTMPKRTTDRPNGLPAVV